MTNLQTRYAGILLRNPIIIGASNIVDNIDNLKKIEDNGAAAIVFKSLFEEQIQLEQFQFDEELQEYNYRHAEMTTLFPKLDYAGHKEHLHKLYKARKAISIPLFASLNALNLYTWVEYSKQLVETGVDGLELNFYVAPRNFEIKANDIEQHQLEILAQVKENVKIPIIVKLSAFYSNPLNFIQEIDKTGADAVVLFNRFYQTDIDIQKIKHQSNHQLSTSAENKLALKFIGLLAGNVKTSLCANGGIHNGEDVIKMILAGADAVQIVGTIYQNKISYIKNILEFIVHWMEEKNFSEICQFKAKLSNMNINDPFVYHRAQYIDLLINSDHLLSKHILP